MPSEVTFAQKSQRLDGQIKRDRSVSFIVALVLHALLFLSAGAFLVSPAQFAVDVGMNSVEVSLVAAPVPKVETPPIVEPPPVVKEPEFIEPKKPEPVSKPIEQPKAVPQETKGQDDTTTQAVQTATVTRVKPDYLKNPAPVYPERARRLGQEGTVSLIVVVSPKGLPLSIEVQKSSGFPLLDKAATEGVRKWKFHPAYLGSMPVVSTVEIPIRFELRD